MVLRPFTLRRAVALAGLITMTALPAALAAQRLQAGNGLRSAQAIPAGATVRADLLTESEIPRAPGNMSPVIPVENDSAIAGGGDAPIPSARSRRSPGLAWALSFLYPGVGQFYNKQVGKGITMVALAAVGEVLIVAGVVTTVDCGSYYDSYYGDYSSDCSGDGSYGDYTDAGVAMIAIGVVMAAGSSIWSQIDAPVSAGKINRKLGTSSLRIEPKVVALQAAPHGGGAGVANRTFAAPKVGLSLATIRF